jgi:hypothetical protein
MDFQEDSPSTPFEGRCHLQVKKDGHGGSGSFATRDVGLKDVVFQTGLDIRVKALSDVRLNDTCYHCLVARFDLEAQTTESTSVTPLKICSGCKTVRYCSSECQKSSWADAHKYECKIFKKLYPRILPSNVRAVMRMLLGEDAEGLYLKKILNLQDHLKDLEESGGQRWQDLCLSAKAAKVYSGTKRDESTVLRLFGILQTNSFTMVTAAYDPIGVALHPDLGYLNHSCEYNATVRFGRYGNAEVVPIRPIKAEEEILISYVDELLPYIERQAELKDRYFFICQCRRCKRESTIHTSSRPPAVQASYDEAAILLAAPSSQTESINSALYALHNTDWEATSYPMPSLRQLLITAYLSEGSYRLALVNAMIQSFLLDPVLYPATHHPIRMVHAWLCVRIINQLLDSNIDGELQVESFSLASFNIDLDFWLHAIVISLHRSANGVAPGEFSNKIDARYNEIRAQWTGREKAYQEQYTGKKILESKWAHVQSAIDYVMITEKGN